MPVLRVVDTLRQRPFDKNSTGHQKLVHELDETGTVIASRKAQHSNELQQRVA